MASLLGRSTLAPRPHAVARALRHPRILLGLLASLPLLAAARRAPAATAPAPVKSPLSTLAEPLAAMAGLSDPAYQDPDGDGVPSSTDNCPFLPNPPKNGRQPVICGASFSARGKGYVFLKSRVFVPSPGADDNLKLLDPAKPAHVLLQLRTTGGTLLPPELRAKLEKLGVVLLGYVPDDTFFASLVPSPANLSAILAVAGVRAISVRLPSDRVDAALRVRGPAAREADQSFDVEVEFFDDAQQPAIESALASITTHFELLYDQTYRARVASWQALERLASLDAVKWIDEPDDDDDVSFTLNAQAAIGATPVTETFGYRGAGITASILELSALTLNPENPDMKGRLTIGNTPTWPYPPDQHAWNVASILIADETSFPDNRGLLPDAALVSYSIDKLATRKRKYYGIPREAREDHDAFFMNDSWGKYRCSKIGEYTGRAKWRDRAIDDFGIIIVDGAGNGRDSSAYPALGCEPDQYSLMMVNAKNSIMVGNWSLYRNALAPSSSLGPTADGRLKPDLVAPGDGIDTLGFETTELVDVSGTSTGGLEAPSFVGETFPVVFGGTSGAAPMVSGVVGWIGEAFVDQGYAISAIKPANVKAILLHTAKDVGLPGPDFDHGYGLLQAAPALRIAQEWKLWGREHTFHSDGAPFETEFDITGPLYTYKATLAWDDEEGEDTSDKALKNDLDLTLVSPSGVVYRPFDLKYPNGSGTTPAPACTSDACDDTNNVEQVVASGVDGQPLEQGTWRASVRAARLVSDSQHMALVLTPPCPVVIERDATLTGPIECPPQLLEPEAVKMPKAGVTLDCDGQEIAGAKGDAASTPDYVGVRVLARDVTVKRCALSRFDIGIKVGSSDAPVTNALITDNELDDMRHRGIDVWGDDHAVSLNSIFDLQSTANTGIHVRGDSNLVVGNQLSTSGSGALPTGIYVGNDSDSDVVSANLVSGSWDPAIQFESDDPDEKVTLAHAAFNVIQEVPGVGIAVSGPVMNSAVEGNVIRYYGPASPAILVEESAGYGPYAIDVTFNSVSGSQHATQTGVEALDADLTNVTFNFLTDLGVGVHDQGTYSSYIKHNRITSADPSDPYLGLVGIWRQGGSLTEIEGNVVRDQLAGVSVANNTGELLVSGNDIDVSGLGISVVSGPAAEITSNAVVSLIGGIALVDGAGATINGNTVGGFSVTGIYAWQADNLHAEDNVIEELVGVGPGAGPSIGIQYAKGRLATLADNAITAWNGGNGIELGLDPTAPCQTINVQNTALDSNTYVGNGTELVTGCDVEGTTIKP